MTADYSAGLSDVTIGIPAYNEERFIAQAIESALGQAGQIIISDNASTDSTGEICRYYVSKYDNISYVRHPVNLGSLVNFSYCICCARTLYFMWLGAHDYIEYNYVEKILNILKKSEDTAFVYANTQYVDENNKETRINNFKEFSELRDKSALVRILSLIKKLSDCSLIHGLHKTQYLRDSMYSKPIAGPDHVTLCRLAGLGNIEHCNNTRYFRRILNRKETNDTYMNRITGDNKTVYSRDEMCRMQLQSILCITDIGIIKKIWNVVSACRIMKRRFNWRPRLHDFCHHSKRIVE